jgi:aryl-alcohol dehydrogenase-like predicted oxidoreductase
MQTRRIGSLDVSVVGLGCNNFGMRLDEKDTAAVVDAALEAGINFLDTADIYGGTKSEEFLGRALQGRRDDVVLATKFGMAVDDDPSHRGGSARWVAEAVENSLRRLDTDRIDLYQLHAPDADTPIEETLGALDRLVRDGKVREIGCSNVDATMIDGAEEASRAKGFARFVSVQNEYSLLQRKPEADVLPACDRYGMSFLPYFPLASGMLTGKYRRGEPPPEGTRLAFFPKERADRLLTDERLDAVSRLEAFASERGHTLLDLAFSWLLSRPAVSSVIAGASRPEQVAQNVAAAGWQLTADDLAEVDALLGASRGG